MTEDRLPLAELLAKAGDGDFLRSVAEAVVQLLMETDVEGLIGAGRHERSGERTIYRNGYRDRTLDTRLGSLQLRIPKLRQGSLDPLRGSSPFLSRAPQDVGEGAGRRDLGSLGQGVEPRGECAGAYRSRWVSVAMNSRTPTPSATKPSATRSSIINRPCIYRQIYQDRPDVATASDLPLVCRRT